MGNVNIFELDSKMLKQVLSIVLLALLLQLQISSATPTPGDYDVLIKTINKMAARIPDFGNIFTSGFTGFYGPSGTIPFEALNSNDDKTTKNTLFSEAIMNQKIGTIVNQANTNMKTGITNLVALLSSNIDAILTQVSRNASLTKLFTDSIKSNTIDINPINAMIDLIINDTQSVVKVGTKTIASNIDGLVLSFYSFIGNIADNVGTANELFQAKVGNSSDPSMITYLQSMQPSIKNILSQFIFYLAINMWDVQTKIPAAFSYIDNYIQIGAQWIGYSTKNVANNIVLNLASFNLKARQCAQKLFPESQMFIQNSIISVSSCTENVTNVLEGILSMANRTFGKSVEDMRQIYSVATSCLSQPGSSSRLACLQTAINNIINFIEPMKPPIMALSAQIQTSIDNLKNDSFKCIVAVLTRVDTSAKALGDKMTICINT